MELKDSTLESGLKNIAEVVKKPKETVTITLERYNDYLFYREKYNKLNEIKEKLVKVLKQPDFDLKDFYCKQLYEIYEKIVK